VPTVASLLVLGALNVVNDARSAFAFTLLAAGLFLLPRRTAADGATGPGGAASSGRRWTQLAVLAALGTGGYWLVRDLILSGALGTELQERTLTQIRQTGSLLLGGRPEWTATWALMQDSPLGHGLGTIPSARDVAVAEQGISVTRIPTVEGYLHNYLMNGRFELHSAVADLWSNLGPAGLLLGLVCGALLVTGLTAQLARREASGLVCFLAVTALWSLAFGPLSSGLPEFVLGLGLLLPAVAAARAPRRPTDHVVATVDAGPVPLGPVPLGAGAR
jgi:hypothetical protein